jgi:hypothetical protein
MGSIIGGGGGGGGPAPDTTTQFIREAPGIEERKLELMDLARQTAQTPISIPDIQVQGLSPLEQAAITQAGQTGVGAGAVGQAITGTQAAMGAPNISQFYNPYQSYVLDEINRQSGMRQNQLAAQAVGAGAFGGGRQGIQAAEEERARLGQLGQAQAVGFQSALQAAQQQQAAQRAGAAQLGTLGQLQQEMAGTDISRQITAGGLQRQLGQAQLDALRQTQLQRSAEPLQRLEFLSNIYAAGPKSTSGITAATLPQSSPLAQSIGTGLGVAQAYQGIQNPAAQTTLSKFNQGGIVNALEIKKYKTGGSVSDDDDESADILNDEVGAVPQYISPEQRRNLMLRPLTSQLLQATRRPGQSEASAVAGALGKGLEGQQDTALELTKYDAAVQAAKEKAKGSAKGATSTSVLSGLQLGQLMGQRDEEGNIVPVGNEEDQFVVTSGPDGFKIGEKTYDSIQEQGTISKEFQKLELDQMENAIDILERTLNTAIESGQGGDLPGAGPIGGRVPDIFTSRAGKALRADFQRASNILLKLRSGAAVTEPEMNRFMQEMSGGTSTSDEAMLFRNINILRKDLENRKMSFIKQYGGTRAMEKFLKEGAIKLKSSPYRVENKIRVDFKGKYEPNPFSESSITLDDGTRYLDINGTVFKLNPKTNTYEYAPPKGNKGG